MKNSGDVLIGILVIIVLVFTMSIHAWGAEGDVSENQLLNIYAQARKAMQDMDPAAFAKVVIPPKPNMPLPTKAELADAKVFIDEIFPDLSKAKLLRFAHTPTEALLVAQTNLEDRDNVNLNAFRFVKQNGRWMLRAGFVGHSFSSRNPQADQKEIRKILEQKPEFKLEAKSAELMPPIIPVRIQSPLECAGSGQA